MSEIVDPDVPIQRDINLFLDSFIKILEIAPHVHIWNKEHISETDRHWLISLKYVLTRFNENEKKELCLLDCSPELQRRFKNFLFLQEDIWNKNVVAEVVWQLKTYIGHLCVDYPFDYYITVINPSNSRPNVMFQTKRL
jgi:hypothetical protein